MNQKGYTILCVDDEPANLKLLEFMLAPRGFTVKTANGGKSALRIIDTEKIDLVLLDIMMPDMDGFEVCRKIKTDQRHINIPVIMITGLSAKSDRIKGIEVGAEEFLSKPFDQMEVLARIKMLLKVKELNDDLKLTYSDISNLMEFGESFIDALSLLASSYPSRIDIIVNQLRRRMNEIREKPETILVGVLNDGGVYTWYHYTLASGAFEKSPRKIEMMLTPSRGEGTKVLFANGTTTEDARLQSIIQELGALHFPVKNIVSYLGDRICIFALNYGSEVTFHDAAVLNGLVMHTLFIPSLFQVKDTEGALENLIQSFAGVSGIHDENLGMHTIRVGLYCGLLANKLKMSDYFASTIRIQASLHDMGNINLPASILQKKEMLTAEEWTEIKKHPLRGAEIIGDHPRFKLAQSIALTHHERWDGTGYPQGLQGNKIPIEGRIAAIADHYDALRNKRLYKPAYDHETACKILTKGDGKTLPQHFDPQVLKAFEELSPEFEGIYERFR